MKNYLAYAAGDAANNVSFTMAGMFLILYYTNVVGIEGGVIGICWGELGDLRATDNDRETLKLLMPRPTRPPSLALSPSWMASSSGSCPRCKWATT